MESEGVILGSSRVSRRRACRSCGQHHVSHEPHVYDYVEEVDEDVSCHICLQPLVTPVDTPCGHTFCRPCLLSFLKVQQLCPVDRKPLSQHLCSPSSLVLKKILEKLKVKCPNTEECQSQMPRGDMEDHLKYRCPGNWVSCPNTTSGCDFHGNQKALISHVICCSYKDHGAPRPPILEGEVTQVQISRTHTVLGIAIVGGADTPLRCVVVQEVFPDGLIAQDGRLQPGDQIIEVDGVDMTSASHGVVCQALRRSQSVLRLGIYRERIEGSHCMSPSTTMEEQETMVVNITKESGRPMGLKLGGRRSEPGIYVMEIMEGSTVAHDGRLQPMDRILAINSNDVRYARLDFASRLVQLAPLHVSLIVSRCNTANNYPDYRSLFRQPDPAMPVFHSRTKSAPDHLSHHFDPVVKDIKGFEDVVDGLDTGVARSRENILLSASCESLEERPSISSEDFLNFSNGSLNVTKNHKGSLGSLGGNNYKSNGSLASFGSPLNKSSGCLSMAMTGGHISCEDPPALPPRHRVYSNDHLELDENQEDNVIEPIDGDTVLGGLLGSSIQCAGIDVVDGIGGSRMKARKSRDSSDILDLTFGFKKSLCIEGCPLQQKTVTISKGSNESLGMRIGGGVASNEGDTPIYIANINPHGPVGKSKQVKKGDILLSVNGQSLLGLSHGQAVLLLKATAEFAGVTLSLLDGPETSQGPANFVPSWLYWLKLPRTLHISKSVVLHRARGTSLGFSIVGGNDPNRGIEPIHVLFVVQSSPAAKDGKLRCGDRLLAVEGHSLESVRHSAAVSLLKQAGHRVHLEVVSWLGTEL